MGLVLDSSVLVFAERQEQRVIGLTSEAPQRDRNRSLGGERGGTGTRHPSRPVAAIGALVNLAIIQIMPPSPDPTEPARVLLAVVATLVCVGLLAAQGPTRRSLRIHPVGALR